MNRFEPLDFIVICEQRPRYLRITNKKSGNVLSLKEFVLGRGNF